MEKINKHNYEAFFLDYYEKNLSAEQVVELMLFLENNPSLKDEFEDYEEIVVEPETNIKFENKEALKKEVFKPVGNVTSENYENYIIGDLEKQITLSERNELESFLKFNPKAKKDYKLYEFTYLKPDLSIVYDDKENLKKPIERTIRPIVRRLYYSVAVAASIAILIGLFFINGKGTTKSSNTFASRNAKFDNFNREVIQHDASIDEAPVRKRAIRIKSKPINQTIEQEREPLILEKAMVKDDIQIASNAYNSIPEIKYLDIYNDIGSNAGSELANNDEGKADFQDLKNYVTAGIANYFEPGKIDTDTVRQLNGWDIADIGLSGLNKISKQNFEIKKQKAEDGTIQSFTFSANNFKITRQKKKEY